METRVQPRICHVPTSPVESDSESVPPRLQEQLTPHSGAASPEPPSPSARRPLQIASSGARSRRRRAAIAPGQSERSGCCDANASRSSRRCRSWLASSPTSRYTLLHTSHHVSGNFHAVRALAEKRDATRSASLLSVSWSEARQCPPFP